MTGEAITGSWLNRAEWPPPACLTLWRCEGFTLCSEAGWFGVISPVISQTTSPQSMRLYKLLAPSIMIDKAVYIYLDACMHVCPELPACDFEPLSPHIHSTTLPVPFIMDTEQLARHPPDSWISLKHASQNEMWMDHYRPTWIHSATEFQKHWPWRALSWNRNLLAWFHHCSIRQGGVWVTVRFPEQSHFAIPWSRKSLLAAVHWWCPTRQWIQSPLWAHQSAMIEDLWHAGTSDDDSLAQSLWTPAYL